MTVKPQHGPALLDLGTSTTIVAAVNALEITITHRSAGEIGT
ncbi:hypothetical protein AB0A63_30630 [Lentzea sp. NPDC042327]